MRCGKTPFALLVAQQEHAQKLSRGQKRQEQHSFEAGNLSGPARLLEQVIDDFRPPVGRNVAEQGAVGHHAILRPRDGTKGADAPGHTARRIGQKHRAAVRRLVAALVFHKQRPHHIGELHAPVQIGHGALHERQFTILLKGFLAQRPLDSLTRHEGIQGQCAKRPLSCSVAPCRHRHAAEHTPRPTAPALGHQKKAP